MNKCDAYDDAYCLATKECDPCNCGGDRLKCDFYAEYREKATKKNIEAEEEVDLINRMPLLIALDELENKTAEEWGWQEMCDGIFQARQLVMNYPAYKRKQANWIPAFTMYPLPAGEMIASCSLCRLEYQGKKECANYCPNCGAKMVF